MFCNGLNCYSPEYCKTLRHKNEKYVAVQAYSNRAVHTSPFSLRVPQDCAFIFNDFLTPIISHKGCITKLVLYYMLVLPLKIVPQLEAQQLQIWCADRQTIQSQLYPQSNGEGHGLDDSILNSTRSATTVTATRHTCSSVM